jgi:glutamine amidotransferase
MIHPIIDEYYNSNPYYKRDPKLVEDKGLVNTDKNTNATTPSATGGKRAKSNRSSHLHESLARTLGHVLHASSASPMLSPKHEDQPVSDPYHVISHLTPSARDPTRPQELGNTKKKRKSLSSHDPPQNPEEDSVSDSSPPRSVYGNPNKVAQYFPELD